MNDLGALSILWADDQPDFVNAHRPLLAGLCRDLRTAASGESALDCLNSFSPDLILADLQMPPGDWGGLWLLERLPKSLTSDVPIIVVSGQGSMTECVQALRLGAADYVEKERLDGELAERIGVAVRKQRERRPLSDYGRIRDLERRIHQKVVTVIHSLSAGSGDTDVFRSGIVPRPIALKTYERMFDDGGTRQEEYFDLLDLAQLIDVHWNHPEFSRLEAIIRPKNRPGRTEWLKDLNDARRIVAHPMRGQLSEAQTSAVARAEQVVEKWLAC